MSRAAWFVVLALVWLGVGLSGIALGLGWLGIVRHVLGKTL